MEIPPHGGNGFGVVFDSIRDGGSRPRGILKCLTDNGVPAPPDGGPGGPNGPEGPGGRGGEHPNGPPHAHEGAGQTPPAPPGVDQGVWDDAMEACASLAPPPPGQ